MTLEELINKIFKDDNLLSLKLATYCGEPAVFLQSAPADTQKSWGSSGQYPRIVYSVEMRADAERKTAGTVRVDLLCDVTGILPEELENAVRECLKDLVAQPDDCPPYCFSWTSKQGFELESNSDKRIIGTEMLFSILEYPDQITTDPDPVYAVNQFLKSKTPCACILGIDLLQEQLKKATEDEPILYTRLVDTTVDHLTYAIAWMKCALAIHIIAPDSYSRSKWARIVLNAFAQSGETIMSDESVMLFRTARANNTFDYLATGQVTLEAMYSMLRTENLKTGIPINNIKTHRR